MNELTIPPSPNWYLSNILASNDDGSALVYGAKHELVVLRISEQSGKKPEIAKYFIPYAHKERITSVAFAPSCSPEFKNMMVSASDDGTVHEGQKVPCVDWSSADPGLIVSASDFGSVVCWDLVSNTIRRLYLGTKMLPNCMACCPHNKDIIAVGIKAGLVLIYNVKGDGHVVFRIRGHESDVVSLAWCPVPYNIFRKEKKQFFSENVLLLASGAKDKTVYFWRTATDGRFESFVNLPPQPLTSNYRSKNGVGGPGNCWVCVRWPAPHTLLSSSQFGELLSWNLKTLISIQENEENEPIVWTCALDKHIVGTKLSSCKIVIDMTGIGGIVYCIAPSPLDPNRLALGIGDNRILLWNMSNGTCDNISTFWQKINNKVMAIAWHPTLESILAFGTGEGRVGVMDISSNKPPIILRLHHRRSVYALIWGPPIVDVGDGDILQYNVNTPDKEPINLGCLISKCDSAAMIGKALGRTDLAWNHDRSLASIGNDNGTVYIVDGKDLSPIHTIFGHKKLVQCLVWHPATVTSESELSPHASWLASAGDCIQVMNITRKGFEVVAVLTSHTEKVVSLAWSPHFNTRLISASYDYTCQVWDVVSGHAIAVFEEHHNAVLCCIASPLHPNMIVSGSADSTVRVWDATKCTATSKPKNKKQRVSDAIKKFAGVQEASDLTAPDGSEFRDLGKLTSTDKTEVKNRPEIVTDHQKRKLKSMFPLTGSTLSHAKHLDILWSRTNGVESQDKNGPTPNAMELGYLDFFGDTQAMRRLLLVEGTNHRDTGNFNHYQHMALWSGDLADVIKEASAKKHLSDWLVSLAPMVSHKFWVECCTNYAQQLAESGDSLKSSSYYLAVHKIEEAVDVLLAGKLVREAVALAKARLPPTDPTVVRALVAWSGQCNFTGMLNLCAHCLVSAGKVNQAAEVLSRSKEASSLSLASQMAAKIGAAEMAVSLLIRSINISLAKKDYAAAKKALEPHPSLQVTSPMSCF
ncbi:hypothetical protein AAG570_011167 [Ranatra chinensis]|uniref:Gem-associated protein 5 n=1 Tax=Ranatra chinensis TaxID=642074 RepID=A0ABD0YJW3_9HEMI